MKKRKILALLLASAMLVSSLAACTEAETESSEATGETESSGEAGGDMNETDGEPVAPVSGIEGLDLSETMNYEGMAVFRPQHADYDEMPIIDEINALANVTVEWDLVPDASLNEKKNVALSTGDIPDFIMGILTSEDLQKNTPMFIPLDEYSAFTPNTNAIMAADEAVLPYMQLPDGHYYSLPFWHEKPYEGAYNDLYINQTWLDAVGMEVPNTIEEFEAMLVAFKNEDPNGNGEADEIPLSFILNHNYFGLFGMYGTFGSIDNTNRLHIKDGEVYFTADKEEWKEATKWFNSLYEQDLLDVEGFSQDRSVLFAKGATEPKTIGSLHAFLIDNVVGADSVADYTYAMPMEHTNGDGGRTVRFNPNPISNRAITVVSQNAESPERLIYWLDLAMAPEYSLQTTYGIFDKQLIDSTVPEYTYEFAIAPDGMSQDDYRYKDAPAAFPSYVDAELYATIKPAPDVERKISYMDESAEYLTDEWIPPVIFTEEEVDELATISVAITDYVLQQQAAFITGQVDIDAEWDNYVAQLQTLNVDRYVEIYQAATDRYYGK